MDQREVLARQHATKVKKSLGGALGMLLAVTIGLFGYQAWQSQPVMHLAVNAEPGEISVQALQDGSKLMINANSDVEITYYRDKRMVKLNRGEVIFEVARDESRPFIVDSGHAKITVLGTRFAVNRLQNLVRVSVDHGRVRVEPQDLDAKASGTPIILRDGQVAEVNGSSHTAQRVQHTAADAFSFINGVVTFDRAGMQEIAETLSRYRKLPIFSEVSTGNNARITAIIKSNDVEKFLRNLPDMAPVSVQSSTERTLIMDRTAKH
jgi:transmembrane sensor